MNFCKRTAVAGCESGANELVRRGAEGGGGRLLESDDTCTIIPWAVCRDYHVWHAISSHLRHGNMLGFAV